MSRPDPIYTHPATKKETRIPENLTGSEGDRLSFAKPKDTGWSVGGWYSDEVGAEFIVKFDNWLCHSEKLLNELAGICVGPYAAPEKMVIGRGEIQDAESGAVEAKTYLAMKKFENFYDLSKKTLEEKKSHSPGLHEFYVFNAIISNDDLNEENLGAVDGKPIVIDYGLFPRFLHDEQIEHAATPFTLASFIGHRNLNGMQLVRRRHFGHDDFLFPQPFRLRREFSAEELTYEEILLGAKRMIATKDGALAAIAKSFEDPADGSAPSEDLLTYRKKYSRFAELFAARIDWMAENFGSDLDDPEKFRGVKWSLCDKFHELMQFEERIFQEAAQKDLKENFTILSELLEGRNRDEILGLDLRSVEKSDISEAAKDKFMLHNALAAGDYEAAKWLAENDICDLNACRNLRTHNYQLFRTTPLHAAIAIYHDKLFYQKKEELEPLKEVIDVLAEKFFARNGREMEGLAKEFLAKNGREMTKDDVPFHLEMTYKAYDNFQSKAVEEVSAMKIQRTFRAHKKNTTNTTDDKKDDFDKVEQEDKAAKMPQRIRDEVEASRKKSLNQRRKLTEPKHKPAFNPSFYPQMPNTPQGAIICSGRIENDRKAMQLLQSERDKKKR